MTKIYAKFIGEDGSLGYKNGREYILEVEATSGFKTGHTIEISREDGGGFCPYKNIETFLENWTDIKVLAKDRVLKYNPSGAGARFAF